MQRLRKGSALNSGSMITTSTFRITESRVNRSSLKLEEELNDFGGLLVVGTASQGQCWFKHLGRQDA